MRHTTFFTPPAFRIALVVFVVVAVAFVPVAKSLTGDASEPPPASAEAADGVSTVLALEPLDDTAPGTDDDTVTLEEYNAAVYATAECAEAAGVAVAVKPGEGKQPAQLTFTAPSIGDAEAAKAALDDCKAQHLSEIETAWALQQAHQPDDVVHQAFSLLTECMVANGAQVDDGFFSRDDLNELTPRIREQRPEDLDLLSHYFACRGQVTEETGFVLS